MVCRRGGLRDDQGIPRGHRRRARHPRHRARSNHPVDGKQGTAEVSRCAHIPDVDRAGRAGLCRPGAAHERPEPRQARLADRRLGDGQCCQRFHLGQTFRSIKPADDGHSGDLGRCIGAWRFGDDGFHAECYAPHCFLRGDPLRSRHRPRGRTHRPQDPHRRFGAG